VGSALAEGAENVEMNPVKDEISFPLAFFGHRLNENGSQNGD
jgi:hypothetical protein